jgi:Pectinacetylesterase
MRRMTRAAYRWIAATALACGCGDDGVTGTGEGSGSSGGSTTTAATATTLDGTSLTPSTGASGDADGSAGSTVAVDSTTGDDTTTGEPPWDGEPLPDGEPGQWQWVDIEGTECIDGSPTGIGVRYGTGEGLVIYFEGGGGCFDLATCTLFYTTFANFDENAFALLVPTLLGSGIFDPAEPDNPVRDWSFVYVPYCTGDVHAGDKDLAGVPGFVGSHQFVGHRNFTLDLQRIGPTFPAPSHVLVTGISAGGYGAAFNYDLVADGYAYTGAPVTLLDDSGPPMSDTRIPVCLQELWRELWGLDDTLPPACAGCLDDGNGWVVDLALYLRAKHEGQRFGLLSSEQDGVIRTFLSGGLNDCVGGLYPGPDYQAGLYELRDEILVDDPGFASYYMPGISHTSLPFPAYTTTEVQGVRIVDWVAALLDGTAGHVSP